MGHKSGLGSPQQSAPRLLFQQESGLIQSAEEATPQTMKVYFCWFLRRTQAEKSHDLHQMPAPNLQEIRHLRQAESSTLALQFLQSDLRGTSAPIASRNYAYQQRNGRRCAALPSGGLLDPIHGTAHRTQSQHDDATAHRSQRAQRQFDELQNVRTQAQVLAG